MSSPDRIVSLCAGNSELLFALGISSKVVGVDSSTDWPGEYANVQKVGSELEIDIDRVTALKPDLVLASLSIPGMEKNIRGLQQAGLPYIVIDPHGFDDIWDNIRVIGRATGAADRAETLIADLQSRITAVRRRVPAGALPPKLFWEWWPNPLISPGGRNWITNITEMAGCRHMTAEIDADSAKPSKDEVVAYDPDYILLIWPGVPKERIKTSIATGRAGWEGMKAVRDGRVFAMEPEIFCRPSQRIVDGLESLANLVWGGATPPGEQL